MSPQRRNKFECKDSDKEMIHFQDCALLPEEDH